MSHEKGVSCNCQKSTISDFKKSNLLPFESQFQIIKWDSKSERIVIETTQDSLVALATCTANQLDTLKGCHSCEKGGMTKLSCRSTKATKVFVSCPAYQVSINCGPNEIVTNIIMSITSTPKEVLEVDLTCNVSCGATTTIIIKGSLNFEASFSTAHETSMAVYEKIAEVPALFASLSQWIYTTIVERLLILGLISAVVFAILVIFKFWVSRSPAVILRSRRRRRLQRQKKRM